MKLSRTERLILWNQYKIMALLEPNSKERYAEEQEILRHGFEGLYEEVAQHIYDDKTSLTEADCVEIDRILDMHIVLLESNEALGEKADKFRTSVAFRGFGGNEEPTEMAYVRFRSVYREGISSRLAKTDNYDAHMAMLGIYRRMMAAWQKLGFRRMLEEGEVQSIVDARRHPDA
jgi:uncharacterized protein YfbU (UPF0304 family)